MSLLVKVDAEIERRSLLKHPFYRMWSEGKLTRENLAGYSMEYFQLVKAVPGLVSGVKGMAPPRDLARIEENVVEEGTHIEPWVRFAGALGVERRDLEAYPGAPGTNDSVALLQRVTEGSFVEGVAALYAYEKQLPEISRSKIDGLRRYYGMQGGDATRYFELHEEADVRHAALWRSYLTRSRAEEGSSIMRAVRGSLDAQNGLLDSVLSRYC